MRRSRLFGYAIAVALLQVLITGCFDRSELEEQAFLVTLGIDQLDKSHVAVIGRVAVPSKLSGTAGGSGGSAGGSDFLSGAPVVSASGRSLHEALNMMNTGIERTINLSHLSAVMFSDRAAKAGLLPYLHTLVRYREFRRTLYVFVTKGSMSDVFLKDQPVLETSATRVIEDLHETSQRTGYATSVEMHQLLNGLEVPGGDPVVPILSYNKQVGRESKKSSGSVNHLDPHEISYVPGQVNRAGGNPVECIGTALFKSDHMVGVLSGEQTRYLQLLNGMIGRIVINMKSPVGNPNYVSVGVKYAEPIRVSVRLSKNPQIRVNQSFEAELLGDQTNATFASDKNRQILERALASEIKRNEVGLIQTVFKKYDAEPFHFFEYARNQFHTYNQMEKFNWRKQLANAQVQVTTSVSLRRLGMQLNPPVAE